MTPEELDALFGLLVKFQETTFTEYDTDRDRIDQALDIVDYYLYAQTQEQN